MLQLQQVTHSREMGLIGPPHIDSPKFLYGLGIRPRKRFGDRISLLSGWQIRRSTGFQYVLLLGYHNLRTSLRVSTRLLWSWRPQQTMRCLRQPLLSLAQITITVSSLDPSILPHSQHTTPDRLSCRCRYAKPTDDFIPMATQHVVDAFTEQTIHFSTPSTHTGN